MQALDNKILAYSNVFAITDAVTKEGFVPNYTCQNGFKSFDRSQPPVGSTVSLEIYKRYREKCFLEAVFEKLYKWNVWFYEKRRTANGLLAWGSNPYDNYYEHHLEYDGVGDWQGASYESGLDNSPMYEHIPFNKEKYIFELDDVGLTGLYIQDCRALGEEKICERLAEKSAQLILKEWKECGHIHENYDPETGEGCNNPRSDKFFHWGGLLAYLSLQGQ